MLSKSLLLTQQPEFHSPDVYETSLQSMCNFLKSIPGLKSIYQVGGISDYGISDIDMLVIFDNGINYKGNPLQPRGNTVNRYLFTHRLFGTTENRIPDLENFTRFGKYKLLYGHPYCFAVTLKENDLQILERQIALEYLVKAFISLHISILFGQVKVRNLLLHVKALKLDLELLNIRHGLFYELVNEFIAMRKTWFEKTPDSGTLEKKILELYQSFRTLLAELLHQHPFYLPVKNPVSISRNIKLKQDKDFYPPEVHIPSLILKLIPLNRRENVLNRIYRFCFRFPPSEHPVPDIIQQRFDYIGRGVEFNSACLPFFLCTAYGLDIFSRKI